MKTEVTKKKSYLSLVVAALIGIAIGVGMLIYSLITGNPTDIDDVLYDENAPGITPEATGPTGPPNLTPPTSLPPSN